jgi:hypothetical protein
MSSRKKKALVWVVLCSFLATLACSCATPPPPQPKVAIPGSGYPNAVKVAGVTVAAVPFDPKRDLYAAPNDPRPRKPDFNWYKAGVCPVRLVFNNDADAPYVINPEQITCTDATGVAYQPYDPREAGDAVVASEAFDAHVRGALTGAILGAAVGAGLGAAVGGIAGGRGAAATGAAIGASFGGAEGFLVGSAASRYQMEARVRHLLAQKMLKTQILERGNSGDGLVYFPAVNITAVRMVLAEAGGPTALEANIPVVMPPPASR